ncbi:hypothetical protein WJX73_006830 [Symbiochloris irregularis]|uniref:Uncharacterized protein n=1 Tax=Symbiochloris irregularis TaxID=706552 RepID=A0AAW1NT92_9CHLO
MVLVLAVHSVQSVTAKVPFSMIALTDLVKKHELPTDVKCRQICPTSGTRSVSLWDVPNVDTLQIWLDEYLDVDCTNEVFEVQEDFSFGMGEVARVRATERITSSGRAIAAAVSERTKPATDAARQGVDDMDSKYHVSEHTSAALKAASEQSRLAAQNAAAAVSKMSTAAKTQYSKALQNERIAAMTASVGTAAGQMGSQLTAGWKSLGISSWKGQGKNPSAPSSNDNSPTAANDESGHLSHASASGARHPIRSDLASEGSASSSAHAPTQSYAAPQSASVPQPKPSPKPAGSSRSNAQEHDTYFTLDDLDGSHANHAQAKNTGSQA